MRCLDECHRLVFKVPDRSGEEMPEDDVICVEYGNKLTTGLVQSVVDVSRLGVQVVVTCDVVDTQLFGKCRYFGPIPVIQYVHGMWVVQCGHRLKSAAQQRNVFIVSRHHHVDRTSG